MHPNLVYVHFIYRTCNLCVGICRKENILIRKTIFKTMPAANGQNYGSELPVTGKEETVAANQLDGLQWGKSGLEMDEERKQQVWYSFYMII